MTTAPRVSVIVPAYLSQSTVGGCLQRLREQTWRDFEVAVVDSSPSPETADLIAGGFPEVILERSSARLLPHAARNRGVAITGGELLVFTDPDIYAAPDWLERLVAAHDAGAELVVGALLCHGSRWLDLGVHLTKFAKWLPGGDPGPSDTAPTAGLLCPRRLYDELGGFAGELILGDADFAWRATRAGHGVWFEPRAVAEHHHRHSVVSFLAERFHRGVLFGELRLDWLGGGPGVRLRYLAASVLPVRMARILALTAGHASRGGQLPAFLATLPVVVAGHSASLAGECVAYTRRRGTVASGGGP